MERVYVGSVGGSNGDCVVRATLVQLNRIYDSVGLPPSLRGGGILMACVANKALL